jgi:hypothetical protein
MPDETLGAIAELIRSKNAGPFWITFDVFLGTDADYDRVSAPGVLDEATVARLYQVPAGQVSIFRLPGLRTIKISFPRPVPQGSFTDRDMHAGQQHIPLAALRLPAATSRSSASS